MHALAERLERPLTFHASLWTELLERLQADQLDLICTAATITPERERQFLFSAPYLRTRLAVIARPDEAVVGLTGFSGKVGVREGTPAEAYVVDCGVQPLRFHFNEEVYRALEERTLGAVVDDLPIGAWYARQAAALQLASLDGTDAQYGLVMRRDAPELKAALDRAMRSVIIEGTYSRLYESWLKALVGDACDVTAVMSP
jgi:ABC-type amino acid transport substrate-binding protein